MILGARVNSDYALGGTRDQREEREAIPQELHGLIIGVGGERVKSLEKESGARICFEVEPEPCMVLRGTPEQRSRARMLAKRLVQAISEERLEVAREMWSAIIGQRGAKIREMEMQSGARMVLKEDERSRPVLAVHGTPEARKMALALASGVIERETSDSFEIDSELAPLLVGLKGYTVKKLEEETDAWIRIERFPKAVMVVKGTAPQREKAVAAAERLEASLRGIVREFGSTVEGWEEAWGAEEALWEERVGGVIDSALAEWKQARIKQKKVERGLLFGG